VAAASPILLGRYLGETSDDIEVVADDLIPLQRHARALAEIALGLVAVRSASGAASEHATNELRDPVRRPGAGPARPLDLARRSEPNGNWAALVKATLTIAAINQWLRALRNTA
jgi:hypothetical protein